MLSVPISSLSNRLPENLRPLIPLSMNFLWVWNRQIKRVFKNIDPAAWDGLGHNPVLLLQKASSSRLEELSKREEFVSSVNELNEKQKEYIASEDTWYQRNYGSSGKNQLVAYFSAEFGVTECLRIYSGGLGILAGDHLKSASDLGVPLVGVGLFYKHGYFSQTLSHDGWQIENYPENNPSELPVLPVLEGASLEPLVISVPVDGRQVRVRAWRAEVGRVPLILLDTNLPGVNSKEDCEITSELYGGDIHTRIKQEIILGIGGAKMLKAIHLAPTVHHMNEGHAAFVILERIRELMEESLPKMSFEEAQERVREGSLFTTHTPVAAGMDVFDKSMMEKYLGTYSAKIGISMDQLLKMGHDGPAHHYSGGFNMAVFALKFSQDVNAVSRLHKSVATKMWDSILQESKPSEAKESNPKEMNFVTNGIHVPSWISDSLADVYDEYLGPGWTEEISDHDLWSKAKDIPDDVLWAVHCKQKARLIEYVRTGSSEQSLDPNALTIGFGRRFATYKRALLFLHDRERLSRLLKDDSRPIQFVFSGKAHPKDFEGKKLIQEIIQFSKSDLANGRVVFLQDYDISVARKMVQGVDVWLNNPRRPLEACGTSGMKAAPNGILNFSILDGWWEEAYAQENGWAIGPESDSGPEAAEHQIADHRHLHLRDKKDAESLYSILENEIIPAFYDRDSSTGVPTRWLERMKRSISSISPVFNTRRMVAEYSELFYFGKKKNSDIDDPNTLRTREKGSPVLDAVPSGWEE